MVSRMSAVEPVRYQMLTAPPVPVREILVGTGWGERYVAGMAAAADLYAREGSAHVTVAYAGAYPAGFVLCELHEWNGLAQLQGLAVHVDCRRRGIAAELVCRAETFARGAGARGVFVDTPVDNNGGRRFYEALGYDEAYTMPQYYDHGLDGVTYQRFFAG
jgi:ribosomal protein S18 acetylase RimI-like enzyme